MTCSLWGEVQGGAAATPLWLSHRQHPEPSWQRFGRRRDLCRCRMKPEPRAGRIGWKGLLEEDRYRSAGELAEVDRIDRSFVSRLLRLTPLALHVVEAIPEGMPRRRYSARGVDRSKSNYAGKHLDGAPYVIQAIK